MEKQCLGEYPEWWEWEKRFINDAVKPIAPDICTCCPWLETCRIRVSLLMNYGQELTDQEIEAIQWGIQTNALEKRTIH